MKTEKIQNAEERTERQAKKKDWCFLCGKGFEFCDCEYTEDVERKKTLKRVKSALLDMANNIVEDGKHDNIVETQSILGHVLDKIGELIAKTEEKKMKREDDLEKLRHALERRDEYVRKSCFACFEKRYDCLREKRRKERGRCIKSLNNEYNRIGGRLKEIEDRNMYLALNIDGLETDGGFEVYKKIGGGYIIIEKGDDRPANAITFYPLARKSWAKKCGGSCKDYIKDNNYGNEQKHRK